MVLLAGKENNIFADMKTEQKYEHKQVEVRTVIYLKVNLQFHLRSCQTV